MDVAHKALDAMGDHKGSFDAETAMEVEGFCQRWQNFDKELAKSDEASENTLTTVSVFLTARAIRECFSMGANGF